MGSCLPIGHTCLFKLPSECVSLSCSMPHYDWPSGGSVDVQADLTKVNIL